MEFNNTTPQQNYSSINTPIQSMVEQTKQDSKVGPLVGSIIIILIFIIGGLYFWGSIITNRKLELETQAALQKQAETAEMERVAQQSSSDETNSIEADLKATNVDSLKGDITDITKEY